SSDLMCISIRLPGMEGKDRDLYGKRQEKSPEYPALCRFRQFQCYERAPFKTWCCTLVIQINKCHQHQQASKKRIDKEFKVNTNRSEEHTSELQSRENLVC